jgi:hypothetical protein
MIAEKPLSAGFVDSALAPALDDLEPRLARYGYNAGILTQELDIRQAEVRAFLRGNAMQRRSEQNQKQLPATGIGHDNPTHRSRTGAPDPAVPVNGDGLARAVCLQSRKAIRIHAPARRFVKKRLLRCRPWTA